MNGLSLTTVVLKQDVIVRNAVQTFKKCSDSSDFLIANRNQLRIL